MTNQSDLISFLKEACENDSEICLGQGDDYHNRRGELVKYSISYFGRVLSVKKDAVYLWQEDDTIDHSIETNKFYPGKVIRLPLSDISKYRTL